MGFEENFQPQTIKTSLGQQSQSQALAPTMTNAEKQRLIAMLASLSSHFWTPDFTPAQAAARFKDYCEDLGGCTIQEVEIAIRDYRLRPKIPGKMKPFPGADDLLELVIANRKHRAELDRIGKPVAVRQYRPLMWWHKPLDHWNADWREHEVPAGELVRDRVTGKLREPVR
jgi:hypothetical protein